MFGEKTEKPVRVTNILNPEVYYGALPASSINVIMLDKTFNIVAKGVGFQYQDTDQQFPYTPYNKKCPEEIVTGAQNAGTITIQSVFYMHLNDSLSSYRNNARRAELTCIVHVGYEEDPAIAGVVLNVFKGVKKAGQGGGFSSGGMYNMNVNFVYRQRLTGAEWLAKNDTPLKGIVEVAESLEPIVPKGNIEG